MRDAALKSIAVGFFDGVHIGHRRLLNKADEVLTFAASKGEPLMSTKDRVQAIKALGIKRVKVLKFNHKLMEMGPEEFARRHLRGRIICGRNWHFGKGGIADVKWLREHGIDARVVPFVKYKGRVVSSTRIKEALRGGKIGDVTAMLGREFFVTGKKIHGKGVGRELGFPTVNYRIEGGALLRHGVYHVLVEGMKGVANFGYAPTFGARAWKEPILEIHFPGVSSVELKSCPRIIFLKFVRPERKFRSIVALKRQIEKDKKW